MKKYSLILLYLGVIIFVGTMIFLNLFRYTANMNADIGGDALTARAIWQYKEIVPVSWIGSTETRIISVVLPAALIYGVTGSMQLSMGIACIICSLLILFFYVKLLKKMKLDGIQIGIALLLLLSISGTVAHSELLFVYATHYGAHVIIMLMTINTYMEILEKKRLERKEYLSMGLNTLLAIGLSFSGMRGMLVIYMPLFILECCKFILYVLQRKKSDKSSNYVWGGIFMQPYYF